jgi:hypothetical protein
MGRTQRRSAVICRSCVSWTWHAGRRTDAKTTALMVRSSLIRNASLLLRDARARRSLSLLCPAGKAEVAAPVARTSNLAKAQQAQLLPPLSAPLLELDRLVHWKHWRSIKVPARQSDGNCYGTRTQRDCYRTRTHHLRLRAKPSCQRLVRMVANGNEAPEELSAATLIRPGPTEQSRSSRTLGYAGRHHAER